MKVIDFSQGDAGALLQEAIEHALARLKASARLTDEAIHESRKALKKARALLRLMRPSIGMVDYRLLNRGLRDAGRALTPMRDPASLLACVAKLRGKCTGRTDLATLALATRILEGQRRSARRAFLRDREGRNTVVLMLERCAQRARALGSVPTEATLACAALRHLYRGGRRAYTAAKASGSVDALHEWRKQAKYLARMLHALAGEGSRSRDKKRLQRLEDLGDVLGDDHDLALLARLQNDAGARVLTAGMCGEVLKRRAKRQKRAFALGRESYARTPKRFIASLGR